MLSVASGGSSYPSSMPLSPAASIAENDRYGLHAGSGERNSIRTDSFLPRFDNGTRTNAERLLRAQHLYTGASYPGISRLYELTHWFVTAQSSPACVSNPAMKCFATFDSPYSSPGSENALTSPSNKDRCVCIPEPNAPAIGFGMKVAYTP